MKKKILFGILIMAVIITAMTSCETIREIKSTQAPVNINLKYENSVPPKKHYDFDHNINITVVDESQPIEQVTRYYSYRYTFTPSKEEFVKKSLKNKMRSIGFLINDNNEADYEMKVIIESFNANTPGIALRFNIYDSEKNIVYSTSGSGKPQQITSSAFNNTFSYAIDQIDWDEIAVILGGNSEGKVKGLGNTALEQMIIRWDIQSRPQGADIFWRVVSKTPDVKSTNNKYLMTTPYEATKAIDIKGLTYKTSSNVRIILRCEKDGYMSQEKEFDVRMVLDQEEISAFFRLVKEE